MSLETDRHVNEEGDFKNDGFSLWFGYGKVNAFKAVQAASADSEAERLIDLMADPMVEIPNVGNPVKSSIDVKEDGDGNITDFRIQINISNTHILVIFGLI